MILRLSGNRSSEIDVGKVKCSIKQTRPAPEHSEDGQQTIISNWILTKIEFTQTTWFAVSGRGKSAPTAFALILVSLKSSHSSFLLLVISSPTALAPGTPRLFLEISRYFR